jgi:hypothetical protein
MLSSMMIVKALLADFAHLAVQQGFTAALLAGVLLADQQGCCFTAAHLAAAQSTAAHLPSWRSPNRRPPSLDAPPFGGCPLALLADQQGFTAAHLAGRPLGDRPLGGRPLALRLAAAQSTASRRPPSWRPVALSAVAHLPSSRAPSWRAPAMTNSFDSEQDIIAPMMI